MEIIDAHVHLIERIAGFGRRGELRPLGGGRARWATGEEVQLFPPERGDRGFLAEAALELMDAHGVAASVLLQGGGYGFQNEYAAEAAAAHPGRFAAAGALDPFCADAPAILDRLFGGLGLGILKFEASVGGGLLGHHEARRLDGEPFAAAFERAAGEDATLVLDLGQPGQASWQPEAVRAVALRHRKLRIVVCHLLGPGPSDESDLRRGLSLLALENVWFDLAALPWFTWPEPYPYPSAARFAEVAKAAVGADKLIWGSDIPATLTRESYGRLLDWPRVSGAFGDAELERLYRLNALDAYPVLAGR